MVLTALFSKQEAEKLQVKFSSELDPVTKQPISLEFGVQEFAQVTGDDAIALFKATVNDKLAKLTDTSEKIKLSTKYGVICSDTALVGVIKSKVKATGEMQTTTVEFGKEVSGESQDGGHFHHFGVRRRMGRAMPLNAMVGGFGGGGGGSRMMMKKSKGMARGGAPEMVTRGMPAAPGGMMAPPQGPPPSNSIFASALNSITPSFMKAKP